MKRVVAALLSASAFGGAFWVGVKSSALFQARHSAASQAVRLSVSPEETLWARIAAVQNDSGAMVELVRGLSTADIAAAARLFSTLPNSRNTNVFLHVLVETMTERDRSAAITFVRSLKDPRQHESAMEALVCAYVRVDPKEAFRYLAGLPDGQERTGLMLLAVKFLARTDPNSAWGRWQLLPPSPERNQVVADIMQSLAERDLNSAITWAHNLPLGAVQDEAAGALVSELAWVSPEKARDALLQSTILPRPVFQKLEDIVLQAWAVSNPEGMMKWVAAVPNATTRAWMLVTAVDKWSALDPAAAASYLSRSAANGQPLVNSELVDRLVNNWSQSDPVGAIQWLDQFHPDARLSSSFSSVIGKWMQYDPKAAVAYAESASDPRHGDIAKYVASIMLSEDQPDAAVNLAKQITNEQIRRASLSKIVGLLNKTDNVNQNPPSL